VPQPNWTVKAGFAKETVWGTPISPPTFMVSVDNPMFQEDQDPIKDKGLRGTRAATKAIYFAAGHTAVTLANMPFYGDDSVHFLMALLGQDTIAGTARTGTITAVAAGGAAATYTPGTGGSSVTGDIFLVDAGLATQEIVVPTSIAGNVWTVPSTGLNSFKFAHAGGAAVKTLFSHTLTTLNTGQPPSYTGAKFDGLNGANARQVSGIYFDELDIKLANPGAMQVTAKGLGKLGSNIATPSFPAYSAESFDIPWQASLVVGGVANARFIGWDYAFKAKNQQIFGMNGTTSASSAISDQLTVEGTFLVVPDDYTEFNYYIGNVQPSVAMTIDTSSTRILYQMSKVAFLKPTAFDHGGNFTQLKGTWEAVDNATDGSTSPIKVVVYNQRATAY